MRSRHESIFTIKHQNKFLIMACLASFILTALIIEVPVLATVFGFARLDLTHYLISVGISLSIIPIVEIIKLIRRVIGK